MKELSCDTDRLDERQAERAPESHSEIPGSPEELTETVTLSMTSRFSLPI
jgi:hypothetical protein